jgi:zinc transport system ATP-binding protein
VETNKPPIHFEELSFSYGAGPPVLESVTVTVDSLDFACVIGPNGGGKTTLLKLVLGLLQPTSGRVEVFGSSPIRSRPRIGYMPQFAAMDPRFPVQVQDVVLMGRLGPGLRFGSFSRRDRSAASRTIELVGLSGLERQPFSAIELVGLSGLERQPFSALSGGQRQRVLLARALASDPDLLLLDEPAAGLDQKVEQDFFELLRELNRSKTVVLVSHDLGFVASFVRTVICVHRRVDVHPTSALDGATIQELYGGDVRLVHHDHRL